MDHRQYIRLSVAGVLIRIEYIIAGEFKRTALLGPMKLAEIPQMIMDVHIQLISQCVLTFLFGRVSNG
jgi:hypothetical protein